MRKTSRISAATPPGRPRGRRMRDAVVAGMLSLLLVACAAPTPYAPAGWEGSREGYAAYPLEENRYRVTFTGNTATARETVENYLLFRAAEITLESGHDYFRVVDQATNADTIYRTTLNGTTAFWPHSRAGYYHGFAPGFASARSYPMTRYAATMEIVVASGEKSRDDVDAYNARSVIDTLEARIVRPQSASAE